MKRNRFFQGLGTLFSNSLSKLSMAVVAIFAFSAQANAQCVIPEGATVAIETIDPTLCNGEIIVNGTLTISNTVNWQPTGLGIGLPLNITVDGPNAVFDFISVAGRLRLFTGSTVTLANGGTLGDDNPCLASERIYIGPFADNLTLWAACAGENAPFTFPQLNNWANSITIDASVSSNSICFEQELTLSATGSVGNGSASFGWTGSGPGGFTYSAAGAEIVLPQDFFTVEGTYTFTARISDDLGFYREQTFTVSVVEFCGPINARNFLLLCGKQTKTLIANFGEPIASYQWFKDGSPISGAVSGQLLLNKWSLGNYTVQATAVGGTSYSAGPITVNRVTVLTEAGDNAHYNKVCLNAETTYSAPYLQDASYSWNVSPSGAQVASTMDYTFTGFQGSFDVFVTSPTGCTRSTRVRVLPENESNCVVEEEPTRPSEEVSAKTAAEFFGNDVALTFYPNPVRGNYKINLSGLAQDETFNVSWFDLTGKQVWATAISTGTGTVVENSINNLSKGIYLVQVNNANHNFTFKVMVD